MCRDLRTAVKIAGGGPWKSMAGVHPTQKGHPAAAEYPWLADIPFAFLGAFIKAKQQQHE
jgi:hypothetical protein